MSTSAKIAVVIPYYKPYYLDLLLASLKKEVNSMIKVYLFDDCSETSADDIIKKYPGVIQKHIKFENNLGGTSLTAQWNRCLSNIGSEEWVWFIPDDDVLKPGTLTKVCDAVSSADLDIGLLHLTSKVIDGSGRDLGFNDTMPSGTYDAREFYYRVLRGETMITLGSQISRRSALEPGFVEFPLGWGSDHATALRCAGNNQVQHINDATLEFRMSDVNISSRRDDWQQKAEARVQFAKWLIAFRPFTQSKKISSSEMRDAFLVKGESFFVYSCPLKWQAFLAAYKTARAMGHVFPVSYPIKVLLLKALTWVRRK
jgi:glycosyltransferase involved in cell wall biosynthesis